MRAVAQRDAPYSLPSGARSEGEEVMDKRFVGLGGEAGDGGG